VDRQYSDKESFCPASQALNSIAYPFTSLSGFPEHSIATLSIEEFKFLFTWSSPLEFFSLAIFSARLFLFQL